MYLQTGMSPLVPELDPGREWLGAQEQEVPTNAYADGPALLLAAQDTIGSSRVVVVRDGIHSQTTEPLSRVQLPVPDRCMEFEGSAVTFVAPDLPEHYTVDGQYKVTSHFSATNRLARLVSAVSLGETPQEVMLRVFVEPNEEVAARVTKEISAYRLLDGSPGLQPFYGSGVLVDKKGLAYRYLATRLEPGDLREYAKNNTINIATALRFGINIVEGLQSLHDQGIDHNDIKPENILIARDGRAEIADLGIITTDRVAERADFARLRTVGAVALLREEQPTDGLFGTIGYISTERMKGQSSDGRSDIYALSILLHELLTGTRPWDASNFDTYAHAALHRAPAPLIGIKRPIVTLLREGYDPHPNNRPTDSEFHAELLAAA